jgi:hypothetical protein
MYVAPLKTINQSLLFSKRSLRSQAFNGTNGKQSVAKMSEDSTVQQLQQTHLLGLADGGLGLSFTRYRRDLAPFSSLLAGHHSHRGARGGLGAFLAGHRRMSPSSWCACRWYQNLHTQVFYMQTLRIWVTSRMGRHHQ